MKMKTLVFVDVHEMLVFIRDKQGGNSDILVRSKMPG